MTSDKKNAFRTLQTKSCGLEETFLTAATDMTLTADDAEYAIEACESILDAIMELSSNMVFKNKIYELLKR